MKARRKRAAGPRQLNFAGLLEGMQRREEGMGLVLSKTSEAWKERMREAGLARIASLQPFSSNALREEAGPPPRPNAMGAMMSALSRARIIRRINRTVPSDRPEARTRQLPLYVGAQAPFQPDLA